MKRQLLCLGLLCTSLFTLAQVIAEKKGITFYEHHSSDMTGEAFGNNANGSKSGYDFVKRTYINSFNDATFGAYQNGEEKDIDMVEHDGPFGTQGASMYLGFTSGISSIWNGDIKGNGTTRWHKVAGGVNVYDSLRNYTDLKSYFDASNATQAISEVKTGEVYIGKIRNTGLYVMIHCTSVKIPQSPSGTQNAAFYFDYKFGSENGVTGMRELTGSSLDVYPNPANDYLMFETENQETDLRIFVTDITGKQLTVPSYRTGSTQTQINTSSLAPGLYTLMVYGSGNTFYTAKFLKTH